ncbi:hypothetical protein CsSME_00047704 [Camellia sinensis var. sinensis]
MLQFIVIIGAAAWAVPLTLLLPPVRRLSAFVEAMEDLIPDVVVHATAMFEIGHNGYVWIMNSLNHFRR